MHIYMCDFILFRIYQEANIFEKNDIVNMKTKSLMLFCYYNIQLFVGLTVEIHYIGLYTALQWRKTLKSLYM